MNDAAPPPPKAGRTPGGKLLFAMLIGAVLVIPLFTVYLLVWDRQQQSETARASIAQGWGGPQVVAGPVVVIPYQAQTSETVVEDGRSRVRTVSTTRELFVSPLANNLTTDVKPDVRAKSIYETVVYDARIVGKARFVIPDDLERYGVTRGALQLDRAELRFGVSDARGLSSARKVTVAGRPLALNPGKGLGATGGSGFFAFLPWDGTGELAVDYDFTLQGNSSIALVPRGGDTRWQVRSTWPDPGFGGNFIPTQNRVTDAGFTAQYAIPDLALGQPLVATSDTGRAIMGQRIVEAADIGGPSAVASIDLVQPVDLYSRVDRSVKYGFLFIGFTFAAFLLFDLVGGVAVSAVEYLLVGAGLILFFVMLLAFAEVIGFALAYLVAAGAIIGLLTAYSAAVLGSWRRAGFIAGLLIALYAVLYVLLSLEALSLVFGSLLMFAALAAIMYLTRGIDWGGVRIGAPPAA
jgi:inner membrane protein